MSGQGFEEDMESLMRSYFNRSFEPYPDGVDISNIHKKLSVTQIQQLGDIIVLAAKMPNGGGIYEVLFAYYLDPGMREKIDALVQGKTICDECERRGSEKAQDLGNCLGKPKRKTTTKP